MSKITPDSVLMITAEEEVKKVGLQLHWASSSVSPNSCSHNPNMKINQKGCDLVLLPQIL